MDINKKQLQKFREVFQKEHKVKLSEEEAREAMENLINYFDLLIQFDQEDKRKEKIKSKTGIVNR
jgi:hypothetical protein